MVGTEHIKRKFSVMMFSNRCVTALNLFLLATTNVDSWVVHDGRGAHPFQRSSLQTATTTTKTSLSLFGNSNIPTINQWVVEPDNGIQGLVSNSPNFDDGDNISTSPIVGVPGRNKVVTTINGSKYRLGSPAATSGTRSLGTRKPGRRRSRVNKGTVPISRAQVARKRAPAPRSQASAPSTESSSSGSSAVSFPCCVDSMPMALLQFVCGFYDIAHHSSQPLLLLQFMYIIIACSCRSCRTCCFGLQLSITTND